jgi:hypothetical protein
VTSDPAEGALVSADFSAALLIVTVEITAVGVASQPWLWWWRRHWRGARGVARLVAACRLKKHTHIKKYFLVELINPRMFEMKIWIN